MSTFSAHPLLAAAVIYGILTLLSGCTRVHERTTTPGPHAAASAPRTPPVLPGQRQNLDTFNDAGLFLRAHEAFSADHFEEAAGCYQLLLTRFPSSSLAAPSRFNLALCLERLEQWSDAVASYERYLQGPLDSVDRKDAWFRQVNCLEHLKKWDAIIPVLDHLWALRPALTVSEEIEILVRRGVAQIGLQHPSEGELSLREAIRMQQRDPRITPTSPVRYYALAEFTLAEQIHEEMRQIALPSDEKILKTVLEKKCRRLLDAQYGYTKVIRIGHPEYAAAAAYRIGALYHHLRMDMLAAPPPPDLTEEERQIYAEILAERTGVLLIKAAKQWERTLKLAERLQMENKWIADTRNELAEITAILQTNTPVPEEPSSQRTETP